MQVAQARAVLVCKKDRGLHFCIDFFKLNVRTKKDSYPLPWIQEAIESLVGIRYFSCLDLKAGFWQITMDEASKQYTIFTIMNIEFFECEHILFGLCNAPTTFQRLMQNCLGELNLTYCLIYLDDMIGEGLSKMEDKHLHHLHVMFECFWEHNLKLKPFKCEFFKNEITTCLIDTCRFFILFDIIYKWHNGLIFLQNRINFILTLAFALSSTKASSGVLENVCLHNRCCCYGKC